MKKQLIEPLIVGICCRISGKQVRVIVTAKSLSRVHSQQSDANWDCGPSF